LFIKMKKGQMQMIFVWIFVAIVAVLIFLYGFKMIKNISDTGEDVKAVKFFQNFEKKVNEFYYLDEGSTGKETFWIPSKTKSLCFKKENDLDFGIDLDSTTKAFVRNSDKNVFLNPIENPNIDFKNVDLLEVENSFCVINKGGNVEITFENIGGNVNVK